VPEPLPVRRLPPTRSTRIRESCSWWNLSYPPAMTPVVPTD